MATAAELVVMMRAETAAFRRDMQSVRSTVSNVEKGMNSMKTAVASTVAGYATLGAAVQVVKAIARETIAAQQSNAKLEATIKATGHAAGVTADELKGLADRMEGSTLFDDNEIKNAMSVLLTFKSVSRDVFQDTIKLAADLSAQGFGELQSTATQLGKALEDPTKGITALTRVGVTFTDQQKAQIETLVKQNKLLEAQRIILGAVRGQVGGVAEAMNTGLAGAMSGLSDQWGDLLKNLGSTATQAGLAERAINALTDAMKKTQNLFGAVDQSNTAALQARADHLRTRGGGAKGEGWGPDWLRRMLGMGGISQQDMDEINRISAQLMRATVIAVRPPPPPPPDPAIAEAARQAHEEFLDAEAVRAIENYNRFVGESAEAYERAGAAAVDSLTAEEEARDKAIERIREQYAVLAEEEKKFADAEAAKQWQESWGTAIEFVAQSYEVTVHGLMTRQIRKWRDFGDAIISVWGQTLARMAAMQGADAIRGFLTNLVAGALPNGPKNTHINDVPAISVASAGGGAMAPSLAFHATFNVNAIDARGTAEFFQQNGGYVAAALVDQIRGSRALAHAVREGGR